MTTQQGHTPVEVTVVHAPACHYCEDAEVALRDLAEHHPIDVRVVEIDSPEGLRLVAIYRPAMNPLVLVDGAYFSSGRLPRKKLVRLIEAPAAERGRRVVGRFPKER